MMASTFSQHEEIAWRSGRATQASRLVAEETAVALSYNGSTHAVMMATPDDLEDFGIGFTLTEGIVERASEIRSIELNASELGIEVRMWLDGDRAAALAARRRATRLHRLRERPRLPSGRPPGTRWRRAPRHG